MFLNRLTVIIINIELYLNDNLDIDNNVPMQIIGPINKGQTIGEVSVKLGERTLAVAPLVAASGRRAKSEE